MIFEWEVVGIHQFMNDKTKCKLSFNWCTKPWITDVFVCKHLILIRINILNLVLWNNVCLHKTPHNHCFDFLTRQVHSFCFYQNSGTATGMYMYAALLDIRFLFDFLYHRMLHGIAFIINEVFSIMKYS